MGKTRRNLEENKGISIATIVVLIIIFLVGIILLIYLLFSKVEDEKKIKNVNEEIERLKLETNNLNERKEEINLVLNNVESASTFINIKKDNYKTLLPVIEEKIKDYDSKEKIAYFAFVVDKVDNLDKIINTLKQNNISATFFTNNKDAADTIINNGNLVGLYLDKEDKIDNLKEEYKDIIDAYNPDLFMVSSDLVDKEIDIESFYKVTENSTAEGKKLLNQEGYINDIVETTADRDFLIIRINLSNSLGANSVNGIISKLKDKNYVFLPLISSSSLIEK